MDKKIFAARIRKARKEAGYSSQERFATEYNRRFRQEQIEKSAENGGRYSGIIGAYKNYEDPRNSSFPKLDVVANMADMLNCDLDYLTGRIDEKTHDVQSVCDYTGLSSETIEAIRSVKEGMRPFDSKTIDILFGAQEAFEWFRAFRQVFNLYVRLHRELGSYPVKIRQAKQDNFGLLKLHDLLEGKQENSLASMRKEWAIAMYDFSRKSAALFAGIEKELERDLSKKERTIRSAIDLIIEEGEGDNGEGHTQG